MSGGSRRGGLGGTGERASSADERAWLRENILLDLDTAITVGERGDDTACAACTSILYHVVMPPSPMNTPVREGETIEGSRTTRNRPYPVTTSAQVLKPAASRIGAESTEGERKRIGGGQKNGHS